MRGGESAPCGTKRSSPASHGHMLEGLEGAANAGVVADVHEHSGAQGFEDRGGPCLCEVPDGPYPLGPSFFLTGSIGIAMQPFPRNGGIVIPVGSEGLAKSPLGRSLSN
jgi:hypothetical protein